MERGTKMADSTCVFITGVGRGIGRALVEAYLSKPNHIVIGSVRDKKKVRELQSLKVACGSRLILVKIESSSLKDPTRVVRKLYAVGIDRLDIVIANAAVCPDFAPLATTDPDTIKNAFKVNTLGPILLFQAVKPLLENAFNPRWVSVSSSAGSVAVMKQLDAGYLGAYGLSKSGMNWFTAALHSSHKFLTAFAIHPGFVPTDMGNAAMKNIPMKLPFDCPKESLIKTIQVIEQATRKETSGHLINVLDGRPLPW